MENETLIRIEIAENKIHRKIEKMNKWLRYYQIFVTDRFKPKFKIILSTLAVFALLLTVLKYLSQIQYIGYVFKVIAVFGGAYFLLMIYIIKTHEDYVRVLEELSEDKKIAGKKR